MLRSWLIFVGVGVVFLLINIDMTIVNLALSSMSVFFHASIDQMQWVISTYLLATTLTFILFGRLSDHYGKKNIFLIGVTLFTLASLVAGVTNDLTTLIIARFLQGLGFAGTLGIAILLIVNAFPPERKGFITGLAATISALGQIIGPTLGGTLLQYLNWHWIFLINIPLGIFSFLITASLVSKDPKRDSNASWQLMDYGLFRNKSYLHIVFIRFVFMVAMSSLMMMIPLYLQNVLHMDPLRAGWMMLSMSLWVALASPITGRMMDRFHFIYPLLTACICLLLSLLSMWCFQGQLSWLLLLTGLMLFGIAMGIHVPSSIHASLLQVPKATSGTAMGLFYTIAIFGGFLGTVLAGVLFSNLKTLSQGSDYTALFMHDFHLTIGVLFGLILIGLWITMQLHKSQSIS